ncbi:MAG TPA: acetyl-CoA carboxylase biotin carboxyl carrier protein subunit [Gemmatimonadales bacterium]|nr:acetyl-CoA carboxylase biotin carboxyl carrier protein subunit [Gemmatimonadales bacterium]
MRYFVTVDAREFVVELDGGRVSVDGQAFEAHLSPVPGTPLCHLRLGERSLALVVEDLGPGSWAVAIAGTRHELRVVDERTRHIQGLTGGAAAKSHAMALKAPMPGLVVRVLVAPGQKVAPGDGLVVLEAMKMENELRAAGAGVVEAVLVQPGQAVERGQVLVDFGPAP